MPSQSCSAGLVLLLLVGQAQVIPFHNSPIPTVAPIISQWASEEWGTRMQERGKLKTGCAPGLNVCGKLQGPDKSETRKGTPGWTVELPKPLYINCWGKFLGYTDLINTENSGCIPWQSDIKHAVCLNEDLQKESSPRLWMVKYNNKQKGQFLSGGS